MQHVCNRNNRKGEDGRRASRDSRMHDVDAPAGRCTWSETTTDCNLVAVMHLVRHVTDALACRSRVMHQHYARQGGFVRKIEAVSTNRSNDKTLGPLPDVCSPPKRRPCSRTIGLGCQLVTQCSREDNINHTVEASGGFGVVHEADVTNGRFPLLHVQMGLNTARLD